MPRGEHGGGRGRKKDGEREEEGGRGRKKEEEGGRRRRWGVSDSEGKNVRRKEEVYECDSPHHSRLMNSTIAM